MLEYGLFILLQSLEAELSGEAVTLDLSSFPRCDRDLSGPSLWASCVFQFHAVFFLQIPLYTHAGIFIFGEQSLTHWGLQEILSRHTATHVHCTGSLEVPEGTGVNRDAEMRVVQLARS